MLITLFFLFLTACGIGRTDEDIPAVRVAGLKGPTSIGMVKMMEDASIGESALPYEFSIFGTADEVTPKLLQGELDIAAVPANLASALYNNTDGAIQVIAINTLGVLYITEIGDSVHSLNDLRGKTIYATGKGTTPEFGLRYLLAENGIDPDKDITIEWKSEATEIVALLKENESGIALLPQPYVFAAKAALPELRVAVDLDEEWTRLENGSRMVTGVAIARKDFIEKNPDLIRDFLAEYKASTEYVNANITESSAWVEKFGIFKAEVAEKAIPYCNITYIDGSEMRTAMEGYLNVLFEQNPKSIGGKIPDNGFYRAG